MLCSNYIAHHFVNVPHLLYDRLVWVLIVTGVSTGFVYVITNRAEKYGSHEKKVNLDVIYNASIDFPSVTICNQNYVRYVYL